MPGGGVFGGVACLFIPHTECVVSTCMYFKAALVSKKKKSLYLNTRVLLGTGFLYAYILCLHPSVASAPLE